LAKLKRALNKPAPRQGPAKNGAAKAKAKPARRERAQHATHSSPPPPPALRVYLETKRRMDEHLTHRVELEQIERAARVLLEGDSGRGANPIVIEAVATILERVADHACALEFGSSAAQRVAAAEALESVQELLVKLAAPRRAEFVELLLDHARRLQALTALDADDEAQAIARAFVMSATRFDRAFRRLDAAEVLHELRALRVVPSRQRASAASAAQLAGVLSARVGAFNDRRGKRAASAFDKAWSAWAAERNAKRS
jgi:hypothetical protein